MYEGSQALAKKLGGCLARQGRTEWASARGLGAALRGALGLVLRQSRAGGQDGGPGRAGQQGHAEQGWKWQKDVPVLSEYSKALPVGTTGSAYRLLCSGALEEQLAPLLGAQWIPEQ